MGCDYRKRNLGQLGKVFQFTHPYGVRLNRQISKAVRRRFQFTHPYGVRQSCIMEMKESDMFQFTHPYGVRLIIKFKPGHYKSFNSRTHMGCDFRRNAATFISYVSIHAPIWGATRSAQVIALLVGVSIHAPIWGATPFGNSI